MKVNLKDAVNQSASMGKPVAGGTTNKRQKATHHNHVDVDHFNAVVNGEDDSEADVNDLIQMTPTKSISQSNPTLDALLSSPIGSKWTPTVPAVSFVQEIRQMMFSFGDYHEPMMEASQMVEDIVHEQMTILLELAQEVALQRNSRCIGIEEIVFLMRNNKAKLARLIRTLKIKDKAKQCELRTNAPEEIIESLCGLEELAKEPENQTKRVKLCYDFLSSIDDDLTGRFVDLFEEDYFDGVKQERNLRLEKLTKSMTQDQYLQYSEARKASFGGAKASKFKDWILKDASVDIKPNQFGYEVLQILAYETVAQIVDMALLVKQDWERDACDPISSLMPNKVANVDFPIYQSSVNQLGNESQNKTDLKQKKCKRSETKVLADPAQSFCITPNHIREVIRRISLGRCTSGPFRREKSLRGLSKKCKLICI